jgi:hypothetical protein
MVDNFDLIRGLLKFEEPGNFYFMQVIQRKKDHKEENKRLGRNNNARLVKAYYIDSFEKYDEYKDEMIALAKLFNARVGINLNPRNEEVCALEMLEQLASCIKSRNFHLAKLYNSVCGASLGTDKTWVVDIDTKDDFEVFRVRTAIDVCEPLSEVPNSKVLAQIPTKSGYHLITKAFNSQRFATICPTVEVHKNNPTCCYIPD